MGLKCNNTMQYVDEILILPNNAMDPQGVPYGKVQKKKIPSAFIIIVNHGLMIYKRGKIS